MSRKWAGRHFVPSKRLRAAYRKCDPQMRKFVSLKRWVRTLAQKPQAAERLGARQWMEAKRMGPDSGPGVSYTAKTVDVPNGRIDGSPYEAVQLDRQLNYVALHQSGPRRR